MQFSGSQITRLSTVHGRRHSSTVHFVCNASARALLTSPRVDRQTAVADHFVTRTSWLRGGVLNGEADLDQLLVG
ncbi:hypothetical protein BASA50_000818 [Batrachochytrium salamandrivorans]|uniref:Uncharacterized protein n=1 Tax=Batrachochytrium salamandrivorans TaxID=1357716 RepID=A0ABQ8ET03_9FUNG|nr:hypothetical protein BASA50_000818 [Batrachochytrium salamandrivorans]KAH6598202.1 hypothetical protein BASA61_002925 [Batrachochytrium salamandrivorans]